MRKNQPPATAHNIHHHTSTKGERKHTEPTHSTIKEPQRATLARAPAPSLSEYAQKTKQAQIRSSRLALALQPAAGLPTFPLLLKCVSIYIDLPVCSAYCNMILSIYYFVAAAATTAAVCCCVYAVAYKQVCMLYAGCLYVFYYATLCCYCHV